MHVNPIAGHIARQINDARPRIIVFAVGAHIVRNQPFPRLIDGLPMKQVAEVVEAFRCRADRDPIRYLPRKIKGVNDSLVVAGGLYKRGCQQLADVLFRGGDALG
ncbi:hypothetical protein D9M70_478800 [compost metagenome]